MYYSSQYAHKNQINILWYLHFYYILFNNKTKCIYFFGHMHVDFGFCDRPWGCLQWSLPSAGWLYISPRLFSVLNILHFFLLQIYRILAFSIVILNFVQLLTRVTYLWTSVDFSRVMVAVPFRMWYDVFQLL